MKRNLEKCLWFLSISHFLILWTTDCYWTLTFSENIRRFLLFLTLAMTFSKRKEPEGWTHFISWLHQSKKGFSNWNHLFWPQLEVKCRLAIFLHFSPNFENISFLKCFRNILLSDSIINSDVKVTGDPHIRKRGISSHKIYVFSTY